MQFDKPKVTIDLDEYRYLKEQNKFLSDNNYLDVAKKIAWAWIYVDDYLRASHATTDRMKGRIEWVMEFLQKCGIYITTDHSNRIQNTHECINIELKNIK